MSDPQKILAFCCLLAGVLDLTAAPEKRILLLAASQDSYTVKAVDAIGIAVDRIHPTDYPHVSPFDYDVIIWGMDESRRTMNADPSQVHVFLETGGVMLCMRSNESEHWPPGDMRRDKSYHLGELLEPGHRVFHTPHDLGLEDIADVHRGSIYRAFCRLSDEWMPIISTGKPQEWDKSSELYPDVPHYGLVETRVGDGLLIMTQMIPEYHWFKDRNGDNACAGARFFENLVRYAVDEAKAVAASRPPRKVPACYVPDPQALVPTPSGFAPNRIEPLDWEISRRGPYSATSDRRGIWTVTHADSPSTAGSFCELTRTFERPATAGRVALRWYVSDTYCGGRERVLGGADHGKTAFVNKRAAHRFMQVLVNGHLVWEQDVLGRNAQPARRRVHLADITEALKTGDRTCRVTLRTEDRQSSGDGPFAIDVFWGAVALVPDAGWMSATQLEGTPPETEGARNIAPGSACRHAFRGRNGQYRILVRLLDRVTDQTVLHVTHNDTPVATWALTADDHRWHWAATGAVTLNHGDMIALSVPADAPTACLVDTFSILPLLEDSKAHPPLDDATARKTSGAAPPFTVQVEDTSGFPRGQQVVTQGLPFARNALIPGQHLRITDVDGNRKPCQMSPLVTWPDGSVRIALTSFLATVEPKAAATYGVAVTDTPAPAPDPALTLTRRNDSIVVDTGVITAVISTTHGRLVDSVTTAGGRTLKQAADIWDLALEDENGRVVRSRGTTVEETTVSDLGPLRTLIVRTGSFADSDGTLVDYRIQLEATAGSNALGIECIIVHREETAETYLKRWSMDLAGLDPAEGGLVWISEKEAVPVTPGALLYQHREDRLTWTGADHSRKWAGGSSPGRFRVGGVAVGTRWFWQRFPQAVRFHDAGVRFDFIPEAMDKRDLPLRWKARMEESTTRYNVGGVGYPQCPGKIGLFRLAQGEALHQELRFVFDGRDLVTKEATDAAMAPLTQRLRAVPTPKYTANTLAFGQFHPVDNTFPRYENSLENLHRNIMTKRKQRREYGFENFGDDTFEWGYGPSFTYWSNSEYDHHHGFALQYLRSADPIWWELAEQQARMYRDVVVIHHGNDNRLGGPRHHNATSLWMPQHEEQYWIADHTAHGPSCGHSWAQGMVDYWFLTGDPWARQTVTELADWYCQKVETNRYGAGGQERGPGWTLIAISSLASALQTERLMDAGNAVAEWLINWQDPMRGVISVPISEQPSYEGGSTFMHGIVGRGLGRWYDVTRDPRVRHACIGISEWISTEPMGDIGRFWYKQSPQNSTRYGATSQCLTALTYARHLSDDPWFEDVALALYKQTGAAIRSISWYPQALAQLAPAVQPAEVSFDSDSLTVARNSPATMMIHIRSTTDKPVKATIEVETSENFRASVADAVTLAPRETTGVPIRMETTTETGHGTARWTVGLQVKGSPEKTIRRELGLAAVPRIVSVEFGADEADTASPMVASAEADGKILHTPRTEGFVAEPHPETGEDGGYAVFTVEIPHEGTYFLKADVYWLDGEGNSFYVSIDGEPDRLLGNTGAMQRWITVIGGSYLLDKGTHKIRIRTREDGAKLRRLRLSNIK